MKLLRYFSIAHLLINASALSGMGVLNETLSDGSNPGIIAKSSSYGQEQLDKYLEKKQTAAKIKEKSIRILMMRLNRLRALCIRI